MHRFTNFFPGAAAGFVSLVLAAGCASEDAVPKTASSGNSLVNQARRMRQSDGDQPGTGLTSQGRDIEKDFGFR